MEYERTAGLMWGVMIGFCLTYGAVAEPKMFITAIFPMFGWWIFRPRKSKS